MNYCDAISNASYGKKDTSNYALRGLNTGKFGLDFSTYVIDTK